MDVLATGDASRLIAVNVILGLSCLGAVVAVLVAVFLDVRERRRWRGMVPDAWPPDGVDPADAYVLPSPSKRSRRSHPSGDVR